MKNKPLTPLIDYKEFFPYGVAIVNTIRVDEISHMTLTKCRQYHNRVAHECWCINIQLKNKNEFYLYVKTEADAVNAQELLHRAFSKKDTFLYSIITKSMNDDFIPDILTYSPYMLEEAIKHLI